MHRPMLATASASAASLPSSASAARGPKVNRLELCIPENVPVYTFDDDDDAVDLAVFSEWYDDDDYDGSICAVQFSDVVHR